MLISDDILVKFLNIPVTKIKLIGYSTIKLYLIQTYSVLILINDSIPPSNICKVS